MVALRVMVALGVLLSYTVSDFLAKRVSARVGTKETTLLMLSGSIIPMLFATLFFGIGSVSIIGIVLSVFSGALYMLSFLLLYKSLETKQVSNSIALTGIEFALIALFAVLFLGEGITNLDIVAFLCIFIGAFLVTIIKGFNIDRGYIPAFLSYVVVASSWILLTFALEHSKGIALPLLINRVVATLIALLYLKINGKRIGITRDHRPSEGIVVGIFNGIGATAFLSLVLINSLALGSVVVAIEPALMIILGYLFYKDRFGRLQIIGFLLLIIGILALSTP